MFQEKPRPTSLLIFGLLIGLAGVWAPSIEAALIRDALELTQANPPGPDPTQPQPSNEKPPPTTIKPCCEWDRTVRLPTSTQISRQTTPVAARPCQNHSAGRFEIVKHILLAEPILKIAGPFCNHPPLGPPAARV